MNPSMVGKKLNVHAARDGTAAGRHGGAREHLIFFRKTIQCAAELRTRHRALVVLLLRECYVLNSIV